MRSSPLCAWCAGKLPAEYRYRRMCCGPRCTRRWIAAGCGPNRHQTEARLRHLARQPRGARDEAEFYRLGGRVYREAPA